MQHTYYIIFPLQPSFSTLPAAAFPASLPQAIQHHTLHTLPSEVKAEASSAQEILVKQEECINEQEGSNSADSGVLLKAGNRFRYPKKNVQSNVVNQCYSFLTTRSKSQPVLKRLLGSRDRVDMFYKIMKQGRKKQTKYMGRKVLEDLALLEDDHPVYILHRKLRCRNIIKIQELRRIIRTAFNYFLKNVMLCAFLTSSKMDRDTVREHLKRAREIYAYLNQTPTV